MRLSCDLLYVHTGVVQVSMTVYSSGITCSAIQLLVAVSVAWLLRASCWGAGQPMLLLQWQRPRSRRALAAQTLLQWHLQSASAHFSA